jgi:putative ABC transport system permease protein
VQRGDFDKALLEDIVALPGVDSYSTSRRATIEEAEGRTQILAIAMAPDAYAGTQLIDAKADKVWPRWDREDALLVSEPYSYQNRVAPGDSVTLRTDKGEVAFSVLGVYQSYDVNGSAVLMSRTIYDRHFDDDGIDSIGLYLDETVTADAMIDRVSELSEGRQALMLNSNAKIRELSLDIFDQTFIITDVLYWLATGVAFIGILSSMLALQLENGREQGLLRALGMTPLQIGGMITLQTGVIGLLSGLAAIPLGVVMAYVLIEVINRRAFGWEIDMAVAPDILLTAVAFAMLSALLAGLYPAWRAGREEPSLVMREE